MSATTSGHALILAAHGSRRQSQANLLVEEQARRLSEDLGLGTVRAAFWQPRPGSSQLGFSRVLDETPAQRYTVLPLFTADGYYTRCVLPRELAKNRRFSKRRVHIVPPLGLRPEIPSLAEQRSRVLLNRFGLSGGRTTLIAIGHGTRRHAKSRESTIELVEKLRQERTFEQVLPAFLDEVPTIEEALAQAQGEAVILLPFLIGGTFHALRDIPAATGVAIQNSGSHTRRQPTAPSGELPGAVLRGDRLLIFDRAIGEDPGVAQILARMAADSAWASQRAPLGTSRLAEGQPLAGVRQGKPLESAETWTGEASHAW